MLEMPSEMKTGTVQSCRNGKELMKCKHFATQNVGNISSTKTNTTNPV